MPVDLPRWHGQSFLDPIVPALRVGATTGVCGLTIGSIAGLFTSAHPRLFASVAGLQWFLLGSSYYYCRGVILSGITTKPTRREELIVSGTAGCLSGAANGALRGRGNIIPGAIVVGLLGLVGQAGFRAVKDRNQNQESRNPILDHPAGSSRWLLFRSLPDDDYETFLKQKLLRVESEIAGLDNQIAELRNFKSLNNGKPR